LATFSCLVPKLLTRANITIFAIEKGKEFRTTLALKCVDIKHQTLRTTLTCVLLVVKVVGVVASDAGCSIGSFEEIAVCLVALTDPFGGVIEGTFPAGNTFAISEIVILLTFVAGVVILVGGVSRTLTLLCCTQKHLSVFASDRRTHFGFNYEFVAIGTSQALFGGLVVVAGSFAGVAGSIDKHRFFFWTNTRFGGGVCH